MRKILLGITVLIFMVSIGYCQDQPLQLIITSDKQMYKVRENIEIKLQFKNISNSNIIFNTYASFKPNYVIKNSKGATISHKAGNNILSIRDIIKDDFVEIKQGEYLERNSGVAVVEDSVNYYELKPDIYLIQVIYKNLDIGNQFGLDVWTGTLTSNTITIEVMEKK